MQLISFENTIKFIVFYISDLSLLDGRLGSGSLGSGSLDSLEESGSLVESGSLAESGSLESWGLPNRDMATRSPVLESI